ncbi:MAG: tripartite tricarboxylate transporter substrate binding protein [Pigmentiphaga sp.]|uniref:Bug family tripartite tricarboxylate transporter substrate binding protein n=1 Tax=Pigmentiphaga sp. TaxID=1977564 RepID=UPI0029A2A310|nr:tripartite tricarboxylate transporter substrate binding protein [Pigmentiphaga sp.]MDX3904876.1 tripartite tricarboxylate transporter substrate binding protein [Pigmentiphaga sp.]
MLRFLAMCLTGMAGLIGMAPVHADDYPARPIRVVLPFPASSGLDNAARMLMQKVGEAQGWKFVIENKPGANGFIAAQEARQAAPDGYTLFFTGNTTHGANSALFKTLPYDPIGDFEPITRVGVFPLVLMAKPQLGVESVAALTELARRRPGELTFAAGSAGPRVAAENYRHAASVDARYIPYKSSPQALTDLIGGHVDFMFLDTVASIPMIQAGRIKGLAVTSLRRLDSLPGVPTMAESGFPGFEQLNWAGVFAPRGVPQPVVDTLYRAISRYVASDEWKQYVARLGGYADVLTPAQTAAWVEREVRGYRETLKRAGVEPE